LVSNCNRARFISNTSKHWLEPGPGRASESLRLSHLVNVTVFVLNDLKNAESVDMDVFKYVEQLRFKSNIF